LELQNEFFPYIIRKELVFIYAKKYKKQDYLVPKTVILIQKTLHFVFYQKHAKKIEKPLALI
jgi:5'(3')-deoxyribonucleotidase